MEHPSYKDSKDSNELKKIVLDLQQKTRATHFVVRGHADAKAAECCVWKLDDKAAPLDFGGNQQSICAVRVG